MKCSIACLYRLLHPLPVQGGAGQELTRHSMQGSKGLGGSPVGPFWPSPEPGEGSYSFKTRAAGIHVQHLLQKVVSGAETQGFGPHNCYKARTRYRQASNWKGQDRLTSCWLPAQPVKAMGYLSETHFLLADKKVHRATVSNLESLGETQVLRDISQRVSACSLAFPSLRCPAQRPGCRMLWPGVPREGDLPA